MRQGNEPGLPLIPASPILIQIIILAYCHAGRERCTSLRINLFDALRAAERPTARDAEIGGRVFNNRKFISPPPGKTSSISTFHSPTETRILEKIRRAAKGL